MSDSDFDLMRRVLAAPSPVGLERAMTGFIAEELRANVSSEWAFHAFRGSAALVVDTHPGIGAENKLTCMFIGHADKIRMQVRKVGDDGKVWISSDSHLPLTLIGNEVVIFSDSAESPGRFRSIRGGTVEAIGAIHFAEPSLRSGTKGIKPEQLYIELGISGDKKKEQVQDRLGLRPGDSILMDRPIRKSVGENSFTGAYLDNGLGCFVTMQLAKLIASDKGAEDLLSKVRMLFTFATCEEIGRFGSRVLASHFKPDILIAVDVNHDYKAAPGVGSKQFPDLEMGKGPTLSVGAITSSFVNAALQRGAKNAGIPLQMDVVGHDTGTDAMASVLGNIDAATASVGIPIRNMHTISELGCTTDVTGAVHLLHEGIKEIAASDVSRDAFPHPDLSKDVEEIVAVPPAPAQEKEDQEQK